MKKLVQKYDIGSFIYEVFSLNKSEKFIENVRKPHEDFKFPTSEFSNQEGVTKSYCCKWIWLKNRTWLTYSPSKDALFCLPCLLFGSLKKSNLASTGLKYWVSASWEIMRIGGTKKQLISVMILSRQWKILPGVLMWKWTV